MRVYLDIDGVLADWTGGVHRALGVPYDYHQWPYATGPGGWHWHDKIGCSFTRVSNLCNMSFWEKLQWTGDGPDILHTVLEYVTPANIILLTTPMPNIMSASGKVAWVRKNLPIYERQLIIYTGGATIGGVSSLGKELFATPDSVLVDDCQTNVDRWRAAGGKAVLVPRWWNELHESALSAPSSVRFQLESLCHVS